MKNRVNYATMLKTVEINEKDYPQERFELKHPVWVVLPRKEALNKGFSGWEIVKISKDTYDLEIIEKFG
jgi:hypothetical protein